MKAVVWALAIGTLALPMQAAHAVELRFGWKPGMSCQVTNSVQTLKGEKNAIVFRLKVSEAPGVGLLAEISGMRPAEASLASVVQPYLPGANDISTLMMPDFLVDAEGNFLRLQDIEKSREAMNRMIEREFGKTSTPEKKKQAMDLLGSKTMLENTVHLLWNPAVASWAGSSWEPGERFSNTFETLFPMGNLPYKATIEAQFAGMKPCDSKQTEAKCALLTTIQKPDPVSLTDLTMKLIKSFGGSVDDSDSFELDLRITTETLTHPETLVPSRVMFEKQLKMKGVEKGKPMEFSGTERREWVFECE